MLRRYPGATGVKTGYTHRAGHCLVATATRHGHSLVAVVLASQDMYGDATRLLDLGFSL
jgi:D-alanyl-D-alanine carboxypeptidase (penicillin-binding protein 5/6)